MSDIIVKYDSEVVFKEGVDERAVIEAAVDADIAAFNSDLQQKANGSPLTRYESAILKSFMLWELDR